MTTIMCLPDEVIDIILGKNDITIEDIINFRCVCKRFQWAAIYDKHREKKFSQRWPAAKKLYDKENEQKESVENEPKDKKNLNFIEAGINCARQLRNYVSQITHEYYCRNESIDNSIKLLNFLNMFYLDEELELIIDEIIYEPSKSVNHSYFINEIKNLFTQPPRRTGCDLTERYFIIKIFHYIRYTSIIGKMRIFEKLPERRQLLERTATFAAQCFQPEKDVFYSCVKASLDSIAQEVLNCLREKHPNNSIFSPSAETFTYWKNNNIDDNHWNEAEGTQIMDTLQEYIFGKLNFRPSSSEDTNLENMCIDNVLKSKYGQEIILLIIYHSVARRLGLRCDIINLQIVYVSHHSIFWKPKYATNNLENVRCFYIICKIFPDCFVDDLSLFRILHSRRHSYDVLPIRAIEMRREIKELFTYLLMTNLSNKPFVFNLREYRYGVISHKLSLNVEKIKQLNTRPEDVKFAVGMIVAHDSCAGVIIGWHRHVDGHVTFSTDCESKMYISALPLNHCRNINFTKQQTNYIILIENHKMCYVEEDDITLTTPKWIENSEIGRYFCKFEDTHYVPNKMLTRIYPQDAAITAQIRISEN